MEFPGMMEKKMEERLDWSVDLIKRKAEKEGLEFDKEMFKEAVEIARTLLVRSEIAYTDRR